MIWLLRQTLIDVSPASVDRVKPRRGSERDGPSVEFHRAGDARRVRHKFLLLRQRSEKERQTQSVCRELQTLSLQDHKQREPSCLAHCGKCTRWPVTTNNSTLAQSQNVRSILNYTTQLESSNICARSWHAKQLTTYGYKYDENYESETTANLD